jgi:hypothetical protein
MECSEALDLLYESFDGTITPVQLAQLNGHRRTCFACAGTLAKAQRFQDLLRRVPQLSVPRGLEARVIEHVLHTSAKSSTQKTIVLRRRFSWQTLLRPALASGGVLAAAIAVFFVAHSVLGNSFHRPVDQTVVATVQGSVQDVAPNAQTREIDSADTQLSTGEVLRPVGNLPAIISITPHLALIMSSGSEVQVSRLHYDQSSGLADAIYLRLRRGTLRVNEILHRDVSPVHVATAQASFMPTGTIFAVSAKTGSTDLAVTKGSVQVQMPGRVFDVIAGHGVHIVGSEVTHTLIGATHKPHLM